MWAFSNLVLFVLQSVSGLLTLYFWVVVAAAVITWIEPNPYNPIVRFIYSATEPVFDWIREKIPCIFGGIDFSPLVVIVAIQFFQQYLIPTIARAMVSGFS